MRTVIGIDVGTTHIKSILFASDGRVLQKVKSATPLSSDGFGSVYKPKEIWEIVKDQLLGLCRAAKGPVDGISITGMAEAGLVIDWFTREEKTDIIPWFDKRTTAQAGRSDLGTEAGRFATTGLHNSFKYGIYKFMWLLEHGELNKKRAVWLSMCDYIAFKLTGQLVTDPTFAARTYVYDMIRGCWDVDEIRSKGLELYNFPKVIPSGEICGECGFLKNGSSIPVAIAGHYHVCAAYGLLYGKKDAICDSAGTSETYIGVLRELPEEGFLHDTGVLYGPFVDGGWFYMASVPSSGHSIEWFRKKMQLSELSYTEMNRKLGTLSQDPTGVLYFPYLTGMGSPWYTAFMHGTLLGLSENDDGMKILKAIMEGIQYQALWLLGILSDAHKAGNSELVCAGGAVKNQYLMQLKADILNRKVNASQQEEATLCGAAALYLRKNHDSSNHGGLAGEFLERSLGQKETYTPDGDLAKKYKKIADERYLPMVKILRDYYKAWGNEYE